MSRPASNDGVPSIRPCGLAAFCARGQPSKALTNRSRVGLMLPKVGFCRRNFPGASVPKTRLLGRGIPLEAITGSPDYGETPQCTKTERLYVLTAKLSLPIRGPISSGTRNAGSPTIPSGVPSAVPPANPRATAAADLRVGTAVTAVLHAAHESCIPPLAPNAASRHRFHLSPRRAGRFTVVTAFNRESLDSAG